MMARLAIRPGCWAFTFGKILLITVLIAFFIVVAIRNYPSGHRKSAHVDACINNLRYIDDAKRQWAYDHKIAGKATVTWDDILRYMKLKPECPRGGVYALNPIGTLPTCSVREHSILQTNAGNAALK